jgi:hypothetical protein
MSGVILATAIGSGVTAAGGIGAVAAAGIGAGTTLYGGAKSFSDANKARKRGDAAQRAVTKAVEEAKKRIDVNRMEQLSIAKEPYELMREAQLVQGATGLQAYRVAGWRRGRDARCSGYGGPHPNGSGSAAGWYPRSSGPADGRD